MAGNTAPIHGRVCRIDDGGSLIDYSVDWSINASIDLSDASRQGQAWKENVVGQGGWNGSMTFHFVAGNTEQKALLDNIITASPGTKITDLKFMLEDTGDYFSGNIFLNGFATSASVGDTVNCSFDFTGDGALALTVA
jgi:hypothetical protein